MAHDFIPDNEFSLLAKSRLFLANVSDDPQRYGMSPEQVAHAQAACEAFGVSLFEARTTNRGRGDVLRKNLDKRALEKAMRLLGRLASAQPDLDEVGRNRLGLSITPPVSPRVDAPTAAPDLFITPHGRGATIRLCNPDGTIRRGRPRGAYGAMIFYAVGTDPFHPPTNDWRFIEITKKVTAQITLPLDVEPGSVVFFNACWLSPTLARGPMSQSPKSTRVLDGMGTPPAIRKAA